jgi:hypothetical protein
MRINMLDASTTARLLLCAISCAVLCACGASQGGLREQAAADLNCKEDEISAKQVKSGYSGDDFGAHFEVEGCSQKALYEKKGPYSWAIISEPEPVEK